MTKTRVAVAALALCVAALPLTAQQRQAPTFSIEGGGSIQTFRGNVFSDLSDGSGAEAMFTVGISNLAIAAGFQRSWHDVTGLGSATPRRATVSGFFVEPRLALPFAASNFTPYLYGRGGQLQREETISNALQKSNVTQLGGGLGSMIYLAKGVQMNVAGGYQFLRGGTRVSDNTRPSGGAFVVRAGLSLGSSGWARDPGF
jgi:hypothetical protein